MPRPDEMGGGRNSDEMEIYAGSPSYLITAGGSPSGYAIDPDIAATTIAVVWNADRVSDANGFGMSRANAMLSQLIVEPFTELGNTNSELAARLATHAVVGCLHDHLWKSTSPSPDEVQFLAGTCVAIALG